MAPSNLLLPHYGHSQWVVDGERFPTLNIGGDSGVDVWIRHAGGVVELTWGEVEESVTELAWREAVVSLADQVRAFYDASPPRRRSRGRDGDALENDGWDAFWAEWVERRTRARPESPASRPAFVV